MATLYKMDGTVQEVKPAKGKAFTIEEMQKLVGGYVELIPSIYRPKGKLVLVDEDGIPRKKGFNIRVSQLLGIALVGDVVICEKKEFN